jgi:DNA modification methylase
MLERNRIYCYEVLEGLKMLDDESVDLIITSPPYNLAGFRGTIVNESSKHNIWHKNIKYGGDANIDNIPENIEEKNENNIKKINILNVKKNELVGNEKEEKKEEIKKENIKEKEEKKEEENKEEENGEEDDDFEDDLKFQNILKNYFFNDKEDLKADEPTRNELNEIKNYYKILQEKNKEFQISQESFIIEVDKEISKITNKNILYKVNSRKQKIQRLIENFMNEINQENNRNKNKGRRRRNNYYNKK